MSTGITHKRLGWKPQKPDGRDMVYSPSHRLLLPPKISPMTQFTPAWDQGELGSCTGHGCGRIFAHRLHANGQGFVMPSRLFIYYCERSIEGTISEDAGAEVRDGLKAMAKFGVPPEIKWKYDIRQYAKKPSAAAYTAAKKDVALAYKAVPVSVDAIKQAIAAGNPVVGGFTVYGSFMSESVAKTGVMPMPSKHESPEGGHCVVWDGFDDTDGHFWCANSWGSEWGQQGWFKMPYENIKNMADMWVLTSAK